MIEYLDLGIALAALIIAVCTSEKPIGQVFGIIALGFIFAFGFSCFSNKETNQRKAPTTNIQTQIQPSTNQNYVKKTEKKYKYEIILNDEILKELGYQDKEKITSITIPSYTYHNVHQIIGIEENLFKDCKYLSSITIPKSVIKIGDSAFENCKYLENIIISKGVKEIGNSTFKNCISLKEVKIPNSVKEIGDSAFENCPSLESVIIFDGVKEIGNSTFKNCISLKEVKIPNSVKKIGANAFENCPSLEFIKIPDNVIIIGDNAFIDINEIEYYGKASGKPWGAKQINKIKNNHKNQNTNTENIKITREKIDQTEYINIESTNVKPTNTESTNIKSTNVETTNVDDPVEWDSNNLNNIKEKESFDKTINISLEEIFGKHKQYNTNNIKNVVNSVMELTNIELKDINLTNDKITYLYNNNYISENIGILTYKNAIKIYQMEYFFKPMSSPQNMAIALVSSQRNEITTKRGIQVGDSEDELNEIYKFDLTKTNNGYLATSEGLILLFKIENGVITKIFIFDAQLYKSGHSPAIVNLNIIIDELLRIEQIK